MAVLLLSQMHEGICCSMDIRESSLLLNPPGINEAPKAAQILWENQIHEELQTLIGLHDLWDQGIAAGMMDRTAEVADKNGIYYETLNITELTPIGLKFCFRDHFS